MAFAHLHNSPLVYYGESDQGEDCSKGTDTTPDLSKTVDDRSLTGNTDATMTSVYEADSPRSTTVAAFWKVRTDAQKVAQAAAERRRYLATEGNKNATDNPLVVKLTKTNPSNLRMVVTRSKNAELQKTNRRSNCNSHNNYFWGKRQVEARWGNHTLLGWKWRLAAWRSPRLSVSTVWRRTVSGEAARFRG